MAERDTEDPFAEENKRESKAARKLATQRDRSKYKKTDRSKYAQRMQQDTEKKSEHKETSQGIVLSVLPENVVVACGKQRYLCSIRGLLKHIMTQSKTLVTVGDVVRFIIESDEYGSIVYVEPRKSVLSRQEHLHGKKEQLIAANIEQVLITASVVSPALKPALIDRYIIASSKGSMTPVILINKIDLLEKKSPEEALYTDFLSIYTTLGYTVIPLSAQDGQGLPMLRTCMQGKSSVFAGQSGVGKSSLINALTSLEIPVGDVISKTNKGSHTTTTAQLIPLEGGGWCIDTPGIRSFGIWDLQKEDLDTYFPEIFAVGRGCKYADCRHLQEPGCAVLQAVEAGTISLLRFESYLKLLVEIS